MMDAPGSMDQADPDPQERPPRSQMPAKDAAEGKKKRVRPPNVNSEQVIWKNTHGFRQMIKLSQTEVRPIPYRKIIKPIVNQQKEQIQKRTRVTRRIMFNPIQQFQEEFDQDTVLEKVPVLVLAEHVKKLVDASSYPASESFFDEVVPTAVEYEGSVKMFHFGRTMKKHSCKQKRLKFQTSWWNLEKKPFKKTRTGYVPTAIEPAVKYNSDKNLFEQHAMSLVHSASQLQKVLKKFADRLNRRRTDNHAIRDSAYFVREFFLMKSGITLRVNRAVDIPDCFVPPIMECGYFPLDATTVKDKKLYLADRYQEAQMEYLDLTSRSIEPTDGFTLGEITANELYSFHVMGRHIHGFYQVWEREEPGGDWFEDHDGTMRKRRYLVDIFNFIRFPLYMPYERWDSRLRVSFDRNSVFLLHLTEIIRVNRPIFTCLEQNNSLYKPITLREMCELMTAHDITPKYFMSTCGNYEFYNWARGIANAEYLSAYCLIVGGSKTMKHINDYQIERRTLIDTSDPIAHVMVDRDSQVIEIGTDEPVQKTFLRECFEDQEDVQVIRSRHDNPSYQCKTTRFIIDIPKPVPTKPTDKAQLITYKKPFEVAYSRMKLMKIRRKIYNLPSPPPAKPKPPVKKKPGRKPVTMEMKLMQKYDFVEQVVPSDIESDFDEYMSDGEDDLMDQKRPTLKRSTSAESIFMDCRIRDFPMEKVCWFHQRKIRSPGLSRKEKRVKKLRRMYRKHGLRFRILNSEKRATDEMIKCYHGKMERLAMEIRNTKIAVRHDSFRHYNIPKVFARGDGPIIDDCADALRSMVTILVAKETASTRMCNVLSNEMSTALQHQRAAMLQLPVSSNVYLPKPEYISMELLTMKRMNHRGDIEDAKAAVRADLDRKISPIHQWTGKAKMARQTVFAEKIAQFRWKKLARLDRISEMEEGFYIKQMNQDQMNPEAVPVRRSGRRAAETRKRAAEDAENARKMASKRRRIQLDQEQVEERELVFEVERDGRMVEAEEEARKANVEQLAAKAEAAKNELGRLATVGRRRLVERAEAERMEAERLAEADRLARERAEAQRIEAELLARLRAETEAEAEKLRAKLKANDERVEAERKKAEADRLAQQKAQAELEAKQKVEAERAAAQAKRLAEAEAEKKTEAERLALQKAEADKAQAELEARAEAEEAKKKTEAKRLAEADRLAKAEAEKKAELETRAEAEEAKKKTEAKRLAEADRLAKAEAEKKAELETRAAAEEAKKKAEAERLEKQRAAEKAQTERKKALPKLLAEAEERLALQNVEAQNAEAERKKAEEELVRKQNAEAEEAKKKAEAEAEVERLTKEMAEFETADAEEAEREAGQKADAEARLAMAKEVNVDEDLLAQQAEAEPREAERQTEAEAREEARRIFEQELEKIVRALIASDSTSQEAHLTSSDDSDDDDMLISERRRKKLCGDHLDYVAKPNSFSLRNVDFKERVEVLTGQYLEELNLEEGSDNLKKQTEALVAYLKNPEKDGKDEVRRQQVIEMAYMTGSRIDFEKLVECIEHVLKTEKKDVDEFAVKVLKCLPFIFRRFLLSPPEKLEIEEERRIYEGVREYLLKDRRDRRAAWLEFREVHLKFLENPYCCQITEPKFERDLKVLAVEQLEVLLQELAQGQPGSSEKRDRAEELKASTVLLLDFLAGEYIEHIDTIRQRVIGLAFMKGSEYDWEKLAECFQSLPKSEQFIENVLDCSREDLESLLESPLDHWLKPGGARHIEKFVAWLMKSVPEREKAING